MNLNETTNFYEIEYNLSPSPSITRGQRLDKVKADPIQDKFNQMKAIARAQDGASRYPYYFTRQEEEKRRNNIFYTQAVFMKDFEDDYEKVVSFSMYYPSYQAMGYDQLRTYFSWRTKIRNGNITETSLSYVFLYIYELLNNIGVSNPKEGYDKLISFWQTYKQYTDSLDKYMQAWLKDYSIYYNVYIDSFDEICEFDLFSSISKYDIRESIFYTDETKDMIKECFLFLIKRIREEFDKIHTPFDSSFFRPIRKVYTWKPFESALFHNHFKQADRHLIVSNDEIYICRNNEWGLSSRLTSEKGRLFISYVMKEMEVVLRELNNYKYKLKAKLDMINEDTLAVFKKASLSPEEMIRTGVLDYYKEAKKIQISIDLSSLKRIREDSLTVQDALIVEEEIIILEEKVEEEEKEAFSLVELKALRIIYEGGDIKAYANESNLMVEVLIDMINSRAFDLMGDSLIDEDLSIYDEYIEQVKELIK